MYLLRTKTLSCINQYFCYTKNNYFNYLIFSLSSYFFNCPKNVFHGYFFKNEALISATHVAFGCRASKSF